MENEDRIIVLLEELVALARLSAHEGLVRFLKDILVDPRHLKAYELSDGDRTQKEVGSIVGLSQPSVSLLWQKWRRLGIVRDANGRVAHLVRPSDLGLLSVAEGDNAQVRKRSPTSNRETTSVQ